MCSPDAVCVSASNWWFGAELAVWWIRAVSLLSSTRTRGSIQIQTGYLMLGSGWYKTWRSYQLRPGKHAATGGPDKSVLWTETLSLHREPPPLTWMFPMA